MERSSARSLGPKGAIFFPFYIITNGFGCAQHDQAEEDEIRTESSEPVVSWTTRARINSCTIRIPEATSKSGVRRVRIPRTPHPFMSLENIGRCWLLQAWFVASRQRLVILAATCGKSVEKKGREERKRGDGKVRKEE